MWWHRFINRQDAYAQQVVIGGKCQYFSAYKPVTPELFEAHLEGSLTLGVPAIDENGHSRWCCFDSDHDDGSLDKVHELLTRSGWRCLREGQRAGRAGHLWLFFESPITASELRLFGRRVMEVAGVPKGKLEFFPKQDKPKFDTERGRYTACSIVRLPLGVHRKPDAGGARGWFAGVKQDVAAQVEWLSVQPLNPVGPIQSLVEKLRLLESARMALNSSNLRQLRSPSDAHGPADVLQVRRALSFINPDSYETWIKVGMGLKTGGFEVSVWDTWSARSNKYEPGKCEEKWETFADEGEISIKSIFYWARENGFHSEPAAHVFGSFAPTLVPSGGKEAGSVAKT